MARNIKRDSEKSTNSQPQSGAPRHGDMFPVKVPPVSGNWHPRAKALYRSLKTSGQSAYYQNSDWEMARIACDLLTICYEAKGPGGVPTPFYKCTMMVAEINEMLKQLGATEGARRTAMRVELDVPLPDEESAEEKALASFYANLTSPQAAKG